MKTIPLTQGKVALVDDEDFEKLNAFKWHAITGRNTFYAARNTSMVSGKRQYVLMHREILRWRSEICIGRGRNRHLGYFKQETEAAKAYDAAAKNFFGEFAKLNF